MLLFDDQHHLHICVCVSVCTLLFAQTCVVTGVYNHLPLTQQEWNEYALTPGDDGTLEFMFQLGKADAAAWAKHSGYGSVSSSSTSAEKGGGSKPGGRRLQTAGGL